MCANNVIYIAEGELLFIQSLRQSPCLHIAHDVVNTGHPSINMLSDRHISFHFSSMPVSPVQSSLIGLTGRSTCHWCKALFRQYFTGLNRGLPVWLVEAWTILPMNQVSYYVCICKWTIGHG